MYILKDTKCSNCGSYIEVKVYEGEVDYGECIDCFKKTILPPEKYSEFVRKHCVIL